MVGVTKFGVGRAAGEKAQELVEATVIGCLAALLTQVPFAEDNTVVVPLLEQFWQHDFVQVHVFVRVGGLFFQIFMEYNSFKGAVTALVGKLAHAHQLFRGRSELEAEAGRIATG